MKSKFAKLLLALGGSLLIAFGTVHAQDSSDDQADVWAVVESQWEALSKGDKKWTERMLTDDFEGWGKNSPAPRNKSSTDMWQRFANSQGKLVTHELYPLSIIVNNDVAVAHYLYSSAYEGKDGEVEVNNGRYTDILVRTGDGWRFLAWQGGDDGE